MLWRVGFYTANDSGTLANASNPIMSQVPAMSSDARFLPRCLRLTYWRIHPLVNAKYCPAHKSTMHPLASSSPRSMIVLSLHRCSVRNPNCALRLVLDCYCFLEMLPDLSR